MKSPGWFIMDSTTKLLPKEIAPFVNKNGGGVNQARLLLRERIHSSSPASITDREMVRIAAKRLDAPSASSVPSPASSLDLSREVDMRSYDFNPHFGSDELEINTSIPHTAIPDALGKLALRNESSAGKDLPRWKQNRPVSAILVDADSKVLAWAWNTNSVIRTRHAEWNLCSALESGAFGETQKLPAGSTLYVSLKPCRMCAARIWESAEDPRRLRVVYLENDPGPLAQGTLLEAGSSAQRRFFGEDSSEASFSILSEYSR
jgi:tRNA(Arg) A34 adenosine deaminase TadA